VKSYAKYSKLLHVYVIMNVTVKKEKNKMAKKNGKYPSKGMNALAKKRPDVAKKIMGYKKGGKNKMKKK
jgi:hypothetical protein